MPGNEWIECLILGGGFLGLIALSFLLEWANFYKNEIIHNLKKKKNNRKSTFY